VPNIIRTKEFTSKARSHILDAINSSLDLNSTIVICLSGGKTPSLVYNELSKDKIDWIKVYLTFGDERNVPQTDNNSNYKMVFDSFINKIEIPNENILRTKIELGIENAARDYGASLLALQKKLNRNYLFDIVLLGIGSDGHTASIFPNTNALHESEKW